MPFLLGFQIFITILISVVIVLQKSSSNGIIVNNYSSNILGSSQYFIVSKITIFFIFMFMVNSLVLAKISINQRTKNSTIIKSLEYNDFSRDRVTSNDNVPKME